jgi:hypothetical protein
VVVDVFFDIGSFIDLITNMDIHSSLGMRDEDPVKLCPTKAILHPRHSAGAQIAIVLL